MPRRTNRGTGAASMDSLMDTLTNVVGILIVILILAQLNAATSVKKIVSELTPVSPEELQKLRESKIEAREALKQIEQKLARPAVVLTKEALEKIEQEIIQLERDIQERKVPLIELKSLLAKLEEQQKLMEERNKEMQALMEERERLIALLAQTPENKPPPPKVVKVPNSRPLPENAPIQRILVANQKVYHIDTEGAMKQALDDFNRVKRSMEKSRIQRNGRPVPIYDQQKLIDFYATRQPQTKDMEVTIPGNRPWTRLFLRFTPKEGGGETLEEISGKTSRFHNLLRGFSGRTVVWFHVMPDSFETYIKARELVEERSLSAGWEIAGSAAYNETITEFEVNNLEEPPKAAPGPPVKIQPPKKSLD